MPYATQAQIQAAAGGAVKLVELADWDGDGVVDAAAIAFAQEAADGWIDSFAAGRYAVPIATPTNTLVQFAAEEAVHRLRLSRKVVDQDDKDQRELRVEWLKLLQAGKVRPSDPAPAKGTAVRSQVVVNDREVSREKLKGYL
jgi:phage gp36-like protein